MAFPWLLSAATVSVPVPNASFESPGTVFVTNTISSWQKTPKPDDFDEAVNFLWNQQTGIFKNTAPGKPDHIDNLDGAQAVYLFANAKVGLFLDGTGPGGEFPVTYLPDTSVRMTVGIIGGGGNMAEGNSLRLELYYLTDSGDRLPVATTTVVYSTERFPTFTHLVDFEVTTLPVKSEDPWAGKRLGIGLFSAFTPELEVREGGYWDLDHIRLTVIRDDEFKLTADLASEGGHVTWPGKAGYDYQPQISPDFVFWTNLGAPLIGVDADMRVAFPLEATGASFIRVVSTPRP